MLYFSFGICKPDFLKLKYSHQLYKSMHSKYPDKVQYRNTGESDKFSNTFTYEIVYHTALTKLSFPLGGLAIVHESELPRLQKIVKLQNGRATLLSPSEIRAQFPYLKVSNDEMGLRTMDDACVHAAGLSEALMAESGCEIWENAAVLQMAADRVTLADGHSVVAKKAVVVAAGWDLLAIPWISNCSF